MCGQGVWWLLPPTLRTLGSSELNVPYLSPPLRPLRLRPSSLCLSSFTRMSRSLFRRLTILLTLRLRANLFFLPDRTDVCTGKALRSVGSARFFPWGET